MKNFTNILIVRTDRIGDVVLTTPVIQALRRAYPQARISILVSEQTKDLVRGNPYLDEVIVYDRKNEHKTLLGSGKLVWELYKKKFDCAVILHTKVRSNFICFLARIPYRVGYRNEKLGALLTHGVDDNRPLGLKHESQYCLDILRSMDIPAEGRAELFVPVQPAAEQWANQWLKTRYDPSYNRLVVIHPGASSISKCWPARSFAGLINGLLKRYSIKVVLVGGAEHQETSQKIMAQIETPVYDLTGCTSLAQTVSLLKRADLLISNDSGPVHVGAALGINVISLFLRDQPGINSERWKPLGEKSHVLSNKNGEAIRLNHVGEIEKGQFDSISVDEVLSLVEEIFGREFLFVHGPVHLAGGRR